MGKTWTSGEPGFNAAVLGTSFNARDPGVRPALYVQAGSAEDVVAAVKRAKTEGLRIALCSGGHSWTQNHIRDGGMLIDLAGLNAIAIDADKMTATIGPGVLSGQLNAALARKRLFFPSAHAWTVGMGGFLLQGGFGWNSRVMGLGCENVLGFDAVLADGTLVHASEAENADLFWAARGAGPGFFAAVVRFHLRLHARPKFVGLKVQVFRMKHLEDVLTWADRVGPQVPAQVEFQMIMDREATLIGVPGIEVLAPVLADSWTEAREAVRFMAESPIRRKSTYTTPLMPISLNLMMKTGEKTLFLPDTHWISDSMWIEGAIDPLLPALRKITDTLPPMPSHALWLNWNPSAARKDMAFSLEGRTYLALYGGFRKPDLVEKHSAWATEHMKALEPYSGGIQLADENLIRRPARFMSDANRAKLEAIRAKHDPESRFCSWGGT